MDVELYMAMIEAIDRAKREAIREAEHITGNGLDRSENERRSQA